METYDDFTGFLRAGSVASYAKIHGVQTYPWMQRLEQHPAYDDFWQGQALDRLIATRPCTVPTMWEQGLWDQEDMGTQLDRAEGQGVPVQQLPGHGSMAAQPGQH